MISITVAIILLILLVKLFYVMTSLHKDEPFQIGEVNVDEGIAVLCVTNNVDYIISGFIHMVKAINYSNFESILVVDNKNPRFQEIIENLDLVKLQNRSRNSDFIYKGLKSTYQSKKYSNIFVISKDFEGEAEELNAAADFTNKRILLAVKENSILERDSLKHFNEEFSVDNVQVVTGSMIVCDEEEKDGCKISNYESFQSIYKQLVEKNIQQKVAGFTLVSNYFTAFTKEILIEIGGFRGDLNCDIDITCRLRTLIENYNRSYKMKFVRRAICYVNGIRGIGAFVEDRILCQKKLLSFIESRCEDLFITVPNKLSMLFFFDDYLVSLILSLLLANVFIVTFINNQCLNLSIFCIMAMFIYGLIKVIVIINTLYKYKINYKVTNIIKMFLLIPVATVYYKIILLGSNLISLVDYFLEFQRKGSRKKQNKKATI